MTGIEIILSKIHKIRGVRVVLDRDLAELYQVAPKVLNQAVKRNLDSFPDDFMFQIEKSEWDSLRSQIVTLEKGRGKYPKYLPYAFTELGVSMLSAILKSRIAVQARIRVMRGFVASRKMEVSYPEYELLREKIKRIESEIRESKMNQLVDSKVFEGKLIQLSQGLQNSNAKIDGFSAVIELFSSELDEFEKSHIIIKKPEDGLGKNENN